MSQKILDALHGLDVANDNHWTADGQPRLDTVKMLAGDPSITRDVVSAALPGFSRTNTTGNGMIAAPAAPQAAAPETAPVVSAEDPDNAPDDKDVGQKTPDVPPPVVAPVTTAQDSLSAAKEKLAQLAKLRDQAVAAHNDQNKLVDKLIKEAETEAAKDSNANAIQCYLASQRAQLEARGAQIGKVKAIEADIGVKLTDLLPKRAPIDNALARKNQRGTGRPGVK